jgi:hypothetical protein
MFRHPQLGVLQADALHLGDGFEIGDRLLPMRGDPARKMMRQSAGPSPSMRRPVWFPSCVTPVTAFVKNEANARAANLTLSFNPMSLRKPNGCEGRVPRPATG